MHLWLPERQGTKPYGGVHLRKRLQVRPFVFLQKGLSRRSLITRASFLAQDSSHAPKLT